MNIKQIIKYIFITTLVSIFVIFPVYKFINPTPERTFEVIGKVSKPGENIVGKYHSEVVEKIYVRIQYNDGEIVTKTFDDPFVAETYVVGQKYVEKRRDIIFDNDSMFLLPFVILIDFLVIFGFITHLLITTIQWYFGDKSWIECFKSLNESDDTCF